MRRDRARDQIIAAANRFALARSPRGVAPFGSRHVQRAVNVCRRFALVPDATIAAAGFNPRRKPRARR